MIDMSIGFPVSYMQQESSSNLLYMEHFSDPRNIPGVQKHVNAVERSFPSCTRQGTKLKDILMLDKYKFSHAGFHHEITRDQDDAIPNYVGGQQNQLLEKVIPKGDEVVKYMSNLPSYLEKGNNCQVKALSIGVLNWNCLEKWQYSQKQMAHEHNGYSPSSSITSLFSTDGSTIHSRRGESCSPVLQRVHHHPLHSPLEASPKEGHVQDSSFSFGKGHCCPAAHHGIQNPTVQVHSHNISSGEDKSQEIDAYGGNSGKSQDSTVSAINHLSRKQSVLRTLQQCEKESDINYVSEIGQWLVFDKDEVAAPLKGITKTQGSEPTRKLQETKGEAASQDGLKGEKSGYFIRSIDESESRCSGTAISSDFTSNRRLPLETDWKTISGGNDFEDQLLSEINGNKHSEPTGSCSQDAEGAKISFMSRISSPHSTKWLDNPSRVSAQGVKGSSQASRRLSFSSMMLSSLSNNRKTEDKELVAGIKSAGVHTSSEELDVRESSKPFTKARKPLRRSSSEVCVAKPRLNSASASSTDNPCIGMSSDNSVRGGLGRLRRFLNPVLKSRVSNSSRSSSKHPSPMVGTTKLCDNQLDLCPGHHTQVKSRSFRGNMMSVSKSHLDLEGSSPLQAFMQVSFKNRFPLFTFAIDNQSDILAATARKSFVPGKDHHNWTYTFFSVREIKRKSGIWLNQGAKSDGYGYVPYVVAQMKVSDSQGSPFIEPENSDDHIAREFDLFAVDIEHEDQYATNFRATNELAAIVVKLPKISGGDSSEDGCSSYSWLDLSQAFGENLQDTRSCTGSNDNLSDHQSLIDLNLSTTVILPGGIHTAPSKGEISTLAQRWRSGGSCDCGGWDLGCQLQVYTNQRAYETKMTSSSIHSSEKMFQLFSQVGQDNQPLLSLAPLKDRLYSVEFNSSMSLLQAFAICISFMDSRRPVELLEPSNVVEK